MKRLILILLTAFLAITANAQSWIPLANGIYPGGSAAQPITSTTYNGNLYVGATKRVSGIINLEVNRWNGSSWSQLPIYSFSSHNSFLMDIIGYQGKIYALFNDELLAFNGSTWSSVALPSGTWFSDLEVVNGNLVVAGNFNPTLPGNYIAAVFDGNSWTVLPDVNFNGALEQGVQVLELGGDLYVLTSDSSLSTITVNLFKYDGTNWSFAANKFYNSSITNLRFAYVVTDGQKLYGFENGWSGNYRIHRIENDSVNLISALPNNFIILDHAYLDNKFYLCGYFGPNTSRVSMASFDGQSLTLLPNAPNGVGSVGTLATDGNLLYAAGTFTQLGGVTYNGVMASAGNFASISGNIFHDVNADCQLTAGETGIGAAIMEINPGNIQVTTDSWGNYSVGLFPGTYTIGNVQYTKAVHQNVVTSGCNNTAPMSLGANQSVQYDIAAELNTTNPDLVSQVTGLVGWRARFGFHEYYRLEVLNVGPTNETNVTVDLTIPAGLQIVNANPNYSSQNNNVYTWTIPSMASFDVFSSLMRVKIDPAIVDIGDSIYFTSSVHAASGETNTANNSSTIVQEVVGAYDPNDKRVSKEEAAPGTDRLEYHIRFQNTGNDTAYRVVIRDTLETSLYADQLEMISASHPYELRIDGKLLTWEFNNILLPDSSVDMAGSQGYIRFSLGVDPSLGIGAVVENDAQIYFDFQPPIFTNVAQTTIVQPIGLPENEALRLLEIYPNPARDEIFVKSGHIEKQNLRLIDASGRIVREQTISKNEVVAIPIDNLKPGLYLIVSENESQRVIITR